MKWGAAMRTRRLQRWLVGVGLSLFSSVVFAATSIASEAIDVADTVPGEDRWQYRYTVTSSAFPQFSSFEVAFDAAKAAIDVAPTAPNADWFVLTVQPLAGVRADGRKGAEDT